MSDTQVLLSKIAALRQQIEQAQAPGDGGSEARPRRLEREVASGSHYDALLGNTIWQLGATTSSAADGRPLPQRLSARAFRLAQRGKGLVEQLRTLGEEPHLQASAPGPLGALYRQTVAMADVALRMVQSFPDTPNAQLRLCEGLEGILDLIAERLGRLGEALERGRTEARRIDQLARLLTELHRGGAGDAGLLSALAEEVGDEAARARPLRFLHGPWGEPARAVAAHGLTVAQVVARVASHAQGFRGHAEAIQAALVLDVGMLSVPHEILAHPGPLDPGQRRLVEGHTLAGAEVLRRALPHRAWCAEAAAGHHERPSGAGYPAGVRGHDLAPLVRLLAACDVYAALACPRPYRPALDPRSALTDALLLAEQGVLDKAAAALLLHLTFFPVGTIVEVADGSVAAVVATHPGRVDLYSLARPVVALLRDSEGRPVPGLRPVDLARAELGEAVRALNEAERRDLLGQSHPELV